MKITDHFKNKAQLIGLKNRVALVLAMLLLPMCLAAQITFAEQKLIENNPEWWHLKDEILMPYDSTYLKLERYPTLEAYKKYIGQTLFYKGDTEVLFLSKNKIDITDKAYLTQYYAIKEEERYKSLESKYGATRALGILKGEKNKKGKLKYGVELEAIEKPTPTYVYNQIFVQRNFDPRTPLQPEIYALKNKYFDIIDVISLTDIEYEKRFDSMDYNSRKKFKISSYNKYLYYNKDGERRVNNIELKDFPVFVLRETETGDTLYSTCRYISENTDNFISPFIFVGGFVALKEKFVGQTIVKMNSDASYLLSKRVRQKWTCVDVSITDKQTRENRDYYESNRWMDQKVTLVLQSENDSEKEYLAYNTFLNPGGGMYGDIYITGNQYLKMEEEEGIEIRKRDHEFAEAEKKREAEINKRKKELTAKYGAEVAKNILYNHYAVGMSKAACREIANYYSVIDKTTTTETWVISNFFGGKSTYLFFVGDKLVRITYL